MSDWIKVSDRRPPEDADEMWVFNGKWVGQAELLGGRFYTPMAGYLSGITHWQFITAPSPPTE